MSPLSPAPLTILAHATSSATQIRLVQHGLQLLKLAQHGLQLRGFRRSRLQYVLGFREVLGAKVGVNHSRLDALVAHPLLYYRQTHAALNEPGRAGVAQDVHNELRVILKSHNTAALFQATLK